MKKDGIKTFHNLSAGGSTQQEDHGDKVSAGSYGSRDKPVKTWATGMKTGVSLILKPGSRASVKAIQVDGDSKVFNHDRPGRVKQKFESVIPGHHMHVEAELMGPGQVKSKASQ